MPHAFRFRPRRFGTALLCALAASPALPPAAHARTTPVPPVVDTAGLPALQQPWPKHNPYRGNALAAEVGRSAFNQSCAGCHGVDADGEHAAAPDLRRLGRSCSRVRDAEFRQRCVADVDHYFRDSVLKGKVKVGVEHMPAWEGVLAPELVWAIRSFVESQAGRKP
ncbi:c-type cytochrome [Thauera sinica]|uniref:C-type cytochrome n=1 Tax=Thauera sinica TaxID=2665146 RepID=A0ABW1AQT1_9RHOO|nr:c-type cytochrome [Thauera sp. K11]ATE59541.1 cytochrome C [Thauera sp. K11]